MLGLGRVFARRDDPVSQGFHDRVVKFELVVALLALFLLVSVFLARQVNLLFGLEKDRVVTLVDYQRYRGNYTVQFKADDGYEFEEKLFKTDFKKLGARKGEKATVRTDGFFWTTIVAIKSEKGFETVY